MRFTAHAISRFTYRVRWAGVRPRDNDPGCAAGGGDRAVPGVRSGGRRGSPMCARSAADPVEEYLKLQKRFAHLLQEPTRTAVAQAAGHRGPHITEFGLLGRGGADVMKQPFAITLDVGSSLANHTGSWRTERPVYVDRLPPCNHACPAGENIQGWLYHAEAGATRPLARAGARQPAARGHGPRLLPPLRDRVQPRPARRGSQHPRRSSAFWATWPSRRAGSSRRPRRRQASACWSSAPDRPGFRPPITCAAADTTSRSAKPARAGGMMRFGIPNTGCRATFSTPRSRASSPSA